MGVKEFYKNYFLQDVKLIKCNGVFEAILIDASLYWYLLLNSLKTPTSTENFHNSFVEYLFNNLLSKELNNYDDVAGSLQGNQNIFLIFDNFKKRNISKIVTCVERRLATRNINTKNFITVDPSMIQTLLELACSKYPLAKLVKVIVAEADTDTFIRRTVHSLLDKQTDSVHLRSYAIRIESSMKEVSIDASSIIIYSHDSDFLSFFPLCERACVFTHDRNSFANKTNMITFLNYKLTPNPYLDIVSETMNQLKKSGKINSNLFRLNLSIAEFFLSIPAIFSPNDFLTFQNFNDLAAKTTLTTTTMTIPSDTSFNLKVFKLNCLILYTVNWIRIKLPRSSQITKRSFFNNVIRWHCFDVNSMPSIVGCDNVRSKNDCDRRKFGDVLEIFGFHSANADNLERSLSNSEQHICSVSMVSDVDQFKKILMNRVDTIVNKTYLINKIEDNFKEILEHPDTSIKKINIGSIYNKLFNESCIVYEIQNNADLIQDLSTLTIIFYIVLFNQWMDLETSLFFKPDFSMNREINLEDRDILTNEIQLMIDSVFVHFVQSASKVKNVTEFANIDIIKSKSSEVNLKMIRYSVAKFLRAYFK